MSDSAWWLQTERLALRPFVMDDLDWLAELCLDAELILRVRILEYYEQHPGLGIWVTMDRTTGERLGYHLLNHIQGESIIQVGYTLARSAWGRGVGTEMARAVLRYGFADLRLPRIAGMASLANVASQRVLLKIGLHRNGERAFPHRSYASEGPMAWFERDREAWVAEHAAEARSVFDVHRR